MKGQRIIGIVLVLLSTLIILLAAQGSTPEEQDITVVLFSLPLGIYAICTKKRIVYSRLEEGKEKYNEPS